MEPKEKEVILIITDVSGYTRFMVSNRKTLLHGQVIITELIKAVVKEVEIPLEAHKLHGDEVFLYAVKGEGEASWQAIAKSEMGGKLLTFFEVFSDKIVELSESNICACTACRNIDKLKLKIIVHSGKALFYQIGKFNELSGVDVIIAHRLLKNSVKSDQYIIMTEPAYHDVEFPEEIEVIEGEERYDEIGRVKTYVYFPRITEEYVAEIKGKNRYSSIFIKMKDAASRMSKSMAIKLGLIKPPKFHHLPKRR